MKGKGVVEVGAPFWVVWPTATLGGVICKIKVAF